MRIVKFRMWNNIAKKYHYDVENVFICISQQNVHDKTMDTRGFTSSYDHASEGSVFEQFTGLYDKNGKEIYEGDILKDDRGKIITIKWHNVVSSFCLVFDNCFRHYFGEAYNPNQLEVIGNIYEDECS